MHKVRPQVIAALLQAAEAEGLSQQALLESVQEHPGKETSHYTVDLLFRLYRAARAMGASEDIALNTGRILYLKGLNLQLYMTTICRDFREYLNVIPSTIQLLGDLGRILIRPEGEFMRLEWHPLQAGTGAERFLSDQLLTTSALIVNTLCIRPVPVCAARFTYAEPDDLRALQANFGTDLQFGQPLSCLYLPRDTLSSPLIQLDFDLGEALTAQSRALFESGDADDPFLHSLREALRRSLPRGEAGVDHLAGELGISRRTLQRRLAERGTHFQAILQALRSQLARHYLADSRLGITDIGFLLGYSDQASFSNAFKIWYGCSPSDYRGRNPSLRREV